jgi:hypothetical protein
MAFGKNFKFGDDTKATSIEKFKIVEEEIKFITILDVENSMTSQVHFLSPLGYFHCWREEDEDGIIHKGSCCKKLGELGKSEFPTQKLILPIAIFKTIDMKTYDPTSATFARIELSQDDYKSLKGALSDEDIAPLDVTKYVIRVRGESSGKGAYARIAPSFRVRIEKTPMLTDNNLKSQARDFLTRYSELIHDSVGRTIDEAKLEKLIDQAKLESGEVTEDKEGKKETSKETCHVVEDVVGDTAFGDEIDLGSIMEDVFLSDN